MATGQAIAILERPYRNSFSKLWNITTKDRFPRTLASPRSEKRSNPKQDLM